MDESQRGIEGPLLQGIVLVNVAEMLSPRCAMQLSHWSRSARLAVASAGQHLDLGNGCVSGKKTCITWRQRLLEMEVQSQLLTKLLSGGSSTKDECKRVCTDAARHLRREENIVALAAPVVVAGSLRGELQDLLTIFEISGPVPETSYLFLGDYTVSGPDPCGTLVLLLLLKARFPSRVTLLRGRHEQRQMTQVYGLHDACMRQFRSGGAEVWEAFCQCFDHMPIAAVVNEKIFCVHSGLAPEVETLEGLRHLDRHGDYGHEGPIADMLWSDPEEDVEGWGAAPKSCGYWFGEDITTAFLKANNLELMVRSKQLVVDGFAELHGGKCITVFSSSNVSFGNQAAVLHLDEDCNRTVQTFREAKQPESEPRSADVPDHFALV